ncbi:MAG: FAD-binding oxidoreductase, partial [Planctomycetota bacterium]
IVATVNGEKELSMEGGKPLLAALKEREVFIPSACGGRGSCGLCKLKIESGGGELLPTELPWLSGEERSGGVRLACQVKVKRPLAIAVPEAVFSVRQFRARVASVRDLTPDIKEVVLDLIDPAEIDFRAGQYVQLEVPPYELTAEPVYRAYSVASPPSRRSRIELMIKYVPGGICTTYVHRYLRAGDEVVLNGPYGEFGLRDSDRDVVMVAGGSGMAPMVSILADMAERGVRRMTRYFFGANAVADLFLTERMREFEAELPDYRFVPVVWRPAENGSWSGERGLVTEALGRAVQSAAECEGYLCGSPAMIDACVEVLRAKGVPEERIFYDKFT